MADKFEWKKCSYVFRGTFVHSTQHNVMEIMQDKIIGISLSGKVCFILKYLLCSLPHSTGHCCRSYTCM